jgi:hypothetical protein
MTGFHKILKGYAAQARWMAANLDGPNGEWVAAGWTKLGNGAVKPVFAMTDGTKIVVLNGQTHLHRAIVEVPAGCIFETEDAAFAAAGGVVDV